MTMTQVIYLPLQVDLSDCYYHQKSFSWLSFHSTFFILTSEFMLSDSVIELYP